MTALALAPPAIDRGIRRQDRWTSGSVSAVALPHPRALRCPRRPTLHARRSAGHLPVWSGFLFGLAGTLVVLFVVVCSQLDGSTGAPKTSREQGPTRHLGKPPSSSGRELTRLRGACAVSLVPMDVDLTSPISVREPCAAPYDTAAADQLRSVDCPGVSSRTTGRGRLSRARALPIPGQSMVDVDPTGGPQAQQRVALGGQVWRSVEQRTLAGSAGTTTVGP